MAGVDGRDESKTVRYPSRDEMEKGIEEMAANRWHAMIISSLPEGAYEVLSVRTPQHNARGNI